MASSSAGPPSTSSNMPPLKQKKSLDWLSKGFKRKNTSSSSLSSNSSDRGGAAASNAQQQQRHARSHGSYMSESTLLSIPGSPSLETSPTSDSDDRDESGYPSPPVSSSPITPDFVASDTRNRNLSFGGLKVSSSSSPFSASSGLPSPSSQYTSSSLQSARPLSSSTEPNEDNSKTPMLPSSSAFRSSPINSVGTPTQSQIAAPGQDYEQVLLGLSNRKALRSMLDDPVGLWKFGQFLASEMNAETLVFWLNAEQHRNDLKRLYALTQKVHSLHIPSNAPMALNITSTERYNIERAIKSFTRADDPFKVAREMAFQALYDDSWPRFLQWRLELLQAKMQQGRLPPPQTSFTLADPSQDRDQPLLLISDGFLDLTGYSREDVLKRNCRFLQGPGTAPGVIARIRDACKEGRDWTEMLLNYRKDGVPFWSLLRIIPLRNANGKLKYLLGAQSNVTSALAAGTRLAHLLADDLDPVSMARPPSSFEHDITEDQKQNATEAMRAYLNSLDKQNAEADPHLKSAEARKEIAKKTSLGSMSSNSNTASPAIGALHQTGGQGALSKSIPEEIPRPRSASKNIHLHAANALAFDGTAGSNTKPAIWTGIPASARPTTSGSLFQRPGTSASYVDTEGRARAQLSLAEQTKEFNESASHYVILDSLATTVLFHSPNLPTDIHIGTDFSTLVGSKHHKLMKDRIKAGERIDIDNVNFTFSPRTHPGGLWTEGVRVCLTPMKDQINEVGAVVVLIQSPSRAPS